MARQNALAAIHDLMATIRPAQINIRSDYVRQRTSELALKTGMTATRIIEEALARYVPPGSVENVPPGMKRVGRVLVALGGRPVTIDEAQAAIDHAREGSRD